MFKYFIDSNAGWARFSIKTKDLDVEYSISYCLSENLKDLLAGLIVLTGYNCHTNIYHDLLERYLDDNNKYFKWEIDQEGATVWFLFEKLEEKGKVRLRVIENHTGQRCVFNEEIFLDDFIKDIINSCNEMLQKFGIIGYYRNFWIEFPIAYFLLLSDYLNRKIEYNTISEDDNQNNKIKLYTTNLTEEINYLSKK